MAYGELLSFLVKRQSVQNQDSNIGSAQSDETNNPSASQLVSTLVPVLLVALVWLTVFIIIRPKAAWKYSKRSNSRLLNKNAYTPALGSSYFGWISEMWKIPDSFILTHQSLDAYLFIRFLKLSVVACLVGCAITFPILFPINATGGGGQEQLNIITMSNVLNPWKFWAHAVCAWLYFGFIMFLITRESIFFINIRQAYLMNPAYTRKLSSKVVLFTAVPDDYLNEPAMREILGSAAVRMWFPTNTKELDELVGERDKAIFKLEGAETKLIKNATAAHLKAQKKNKGASAEKNSADTADTEHGSVAARYLSPKDRPTHKLKFLVGKKVDTIDWARTELQTLMPKAAAEQDKHRAGDAPLMRAVFVEFTNCREAQAAYQSLTHHGVMKMAPRFTGMHPADVIWSNLRIKGWERYVRNALVTGFVVALIIFWSVPVAVVGIISNVPFLVEKLPWLGFINSIPSVILGVITGLLPAVALAVLMALLPPILRLAAILGGAPTYSDAEYTMQNYYFGFQVVQVFLITTLSSAATTAVTQIIDNPASVTSLLSTQLPKASNFFLSYMIVQGLGVFAGVLVGLAALFVTPLLVKLLGSTPRKVFQRWNRLTTISWGVVYPIYTNLWVIAICYAVIAPLVLLFAAIGLFFFYFAYRYNMLFVFDTRIDEKGLGYARALQHLFVGLYIAELCLVGLFATRLSDIGSIGPFILMILLLIFTALYQIGLKSAIGPLMTYLPKTLEAEESRALHARNPNSAHNAAEKGELNHDHVDGQNGHNGTAADVSKTSTMLNGDAPPHKKPGLIQKFLKPHIYNDYATMRRLVPSMVDDDRAPDDIDEDLVADAYLPPSVWSETPTILLPRDTLGVSRQEVADTSKAGIPINDEAAHLDDKGKIVTDDDQMSRFWFETRDQKMRNDPALSSGLLADRKH